MLGEACGGLPVKENAQGTAAHLPGMAIVTRDLLMINIQVHFSTGYMEGRRSCSTSQPRGATPGFEPVVDGRGSLKM